MITTLVPNVDSAAGPFGSVMVGRYSGTVIIGRDE